MNIRKQLKPYIDTSDLPTETVLKYLPNMEIEKEDIKVIMINEVAASDVEDDFYSNIKDALYLQTTIPLFHNAGLKVQTMQDILDLGIYVTNAIKVPKQHTTIPTSRIQEHSYILEKELALFPNTAVIMLMGDVAKKAYNMINKRATGKNIVPAISTYKLRNSELYNGNIRILPSYIMTGKNILIEKSKFQMATEDIQTMHKIIES